MVSPVSPRCEECGFVEPAGCPGTAHVCGPKKMFDFPESHHDAFTAGYLNGQKSIVDTLLKDANLEVEALKLKLSMALCRCGEKDQINLSLHIASCEYSKAFAAGGKG